MKMVKIEENYNHIIKKHNDLIKSKNVLSSTAHKMLCSVISMIRTDDTEFQQYALNKNDYLKLIDSKSKNDDFYELQARELMSNPFRIDGCLYNWCSKVDLKSMEGFIIFKIDSDLKPYLLNLQKNFTEYELVNILSLRGNYSPKLYEILIMKWNEHIAFHKNSKSYTFELNVDDMINILGIPKSYRYSDIKKQIVEVAKKQFKEKTNIKFEYKEQKIGRKVDRLIINISANIKQKSTTNKNSLVPMEDMKSSLDSDIQMMIGLYEITQIVPMMDGSFKVVFSSGDEKTCKTKKQLKYMFGKGFADEI